MTARGRTARSAPVGTKRTGNGGIAPRAAERRTGQQSAPAVKVRRATERDAERVGALAHAFAGYLRALGDPTDFQFNARTYLRDGFGDDPAFHGLVAESGRRVVGYLLYHLGYDCDRAARTLFVADLYVDESYRRRGAGRALMQAAYTAALRAKCCEMIWSVYTPNRAAHRFYRRLGASSIDDLQFMRLEVTRVRPANRRSSKPGRHSPPEPG